MDFFSILVSGMDSWNRHSRHTAQAVCQPRFYQRPRLYFIWYRRRFHFRRSFRTDRLLALSRKCNCRHCDGVDCRALNRAILAWALVGLFRPQFQLRRLCLPCRFPSLGRARICHGHLGKPPHLCSTDASSFPCCKNSDSYRSRNSCGRYHCNRSFIIKSGKKERTLGNGRRVADPNQQPPGKMDLPAHWPPYPEGIPTYQKSRNFF